MSATDQMSAPLPSQTWLCIGTSAQKQLCKRAASEPTKQSKKSKTSQKQSGTRQLAGLWADLPVQQPHNSLPELLQVADCFLLPAML